LGNRGNRARRVDYIRNIRMVSNDMTSSRLVIIIFLVVTGTLMLYILQGVLAPLVLAGVCAMILHPVYKKILAVLKNRSNAASLLVTVAMVICVVVPLVFLFLALWQEFMVVYWNVYGTIHVSGMQGIFTTSWWHQISALLKTYGIDEQGFVRNVVMPFLSNISAYGSRFFAGIVSNAAGLGFGFVIMVVSLFFFLRDGDTFVSFLIKLIPLAERETNHMIQTFKRVVKGILLGNFLTAIAQGVIGGIGFWIFGLPAPTLWGTIMAVMAMIPFVGPGVVYIPATVFIFLGTGSLEKTFMFLAYNLLIVSTVDNIIKPAIIGTRTHIHPLIILLSLVAGVKLWGVIGILYGPLVAALFLLAIDFYLEETKQRSLF